MSLFASTWTRSRFARARTFLLTLTAAALLSPAIALGQGPAPTASEDTRVGTPSDPSSMLAAQTFLAGQAKSDPSGKAGSGGRAVKHHANGRGAQPSSASARLHRTGHLALEPTLGVLRDGTVYLAQVAWDPVESGFQTLVLSTRDGARFTDVTPRTSGVNNHPSTNDPYLYAEPRTGRVFLNDYAGCGQTSSTDNRGKSWSAPGFACSQLSDHQNLFGGRPVTSKLQGTYPEILYYCAASLGLTEAATGSAGCMKSLDGGLQWQPTRGVAWTPQPYQPSEGAMGRVCTGLIGHGVVAPNGTVYLPKNCDSPMLLASRDEGDTWITLTLPTKLGVIRGAQGHPDHEAAVAVDAKGTLYVAWVARNRMPYLMTSRNGGKTWSAPLNVVAPGVQETTQPTLAVTPGGRVAVGYMGTTSSPGRPWPNDSNCTPPFVASCDGYGAIDGYAKTTWNTYLTVTDEPLAKNPWFISVSINDPADPLTVGICEPLRCQQQFDFGDVQLGPDGTPWVARVDGCTRDRKCVDIGEGILGRMVGLPRHS